MDVSSKPKLQTESTISIAYISDVGSVRKNNEDNFIVTDLTSEKNFDAEEELIARPVGDLGWLLAVSDGMGGAQAGEVASQMATQILAEQLIAAPNNEQPEELLGEYLKIVNRELRKVGQSRAEYNGMGATITAAIIRNGRAYLSQVGDSRGYLVRDRKIRQITKDQSLAQALIDIGQLTEESAAHFPNRNIILSALGADDNIEPEISTVDMELGDYLLLCSDGLSNKVSSAEMLNIVLQTQTLHSACEQLIELANINGGEDNITLILARLNGVELPEPDVRSKSLI